MPRAFVPCFARLALLSLALSCPSATVADAQPAAVRAPDATITGLVEDMLGGAIAGAIVTATCGDVTRRGTTDASGRFLFEGLPAAPCRVEARPDLFRPLVQSIDLSGRRDGFLRFAVELAGVTSEVTVTPARGEQERTFDVPEAVGVVTREELDTRPATLLPQALREETGVVVQQTTTAQASVFIRGFSAQRVLYLVDGVRFNTASFRAGATQYLGWIDPSAVQRLEILRGPSSVQYGSDAMGGAVNVITARPEVVATGWRSRGQVELAGATADLSGGAHVFGDWSGPGLALRGGASSRAAGELRTGGGVDSRSALTRYLGLPSTVLYDRLPGTGYRQTGWSAAATRPWGEGSSLTAVLMQEVQDGVQRYDRVLGGDGLFRSTFEPQRLTFGYVRYQRAAIGPFATVQATGSLNRQQDDRLEQLRPVSALERETGRTRALGVAAEGTLRPWRGHTLTIGAEQFHEGMDTSRTRTLDGRTTALRPEIPDGATYRSTAVFAQDQASLAGGRLAVRAGVRASSFVYDAPVDAVLGVAADRVRMSAVTFNVGSVVRVTDAVNLTATVGRGFRAANAFDLGAIGVSGGGFEIAPGTAASLGAMVGTNDGATAVSSGSAVTGLGAESMLTVDAGLKVRTRRVAASVVAFDLGLRDAIARRTAIFPPGIVGTDVAGYAIVAQDADGRAYVAVDPRPIVTRVNVERGRVRGVDADVQVRLGRAWVASANASMASGRDGDGQYLRRMPAPMGTVRLKWEPGTQPMWLEGVVTLIGTQDRLSPGDLSDARIGARRRRADVATFFNGTATDLGLVRDGVLVSTGESLAQVQARVLGGADASFLFTTTPGATVASLRAGWRFTSRLDATVIVDNLTDARYRWHGSGVDAPGISIAAKLRIRL